MHSKSSTGQSASPPVVEISQPTQRPRPNVSEHLANERTYLAYLRTSVSLISFGITINRFAIFLIQSNRVPERASERWDMVTVSRLGFGMVVFGLFLLIWAGIHFSKVSRGIDRGDYRPSQLSAWVITIGVLVAGAISLIWLFPR
jgi:putative membrane protein